jgi:DNA repair protein RadC
MSHDLLSSLDSLCLPVAGSYASSLLVREGPGGYRAAQADEVLLAAQRLLAQRVRGTDVLSSPAEVREFLRARLSSLDHEVFALLHLDAQHRVLDYVELFRGTLAQTSVYPREVVKDALRLNSAAVVLDHNHPSGLAEPSSADRVLTQTLSSALLLVDVRVLDHFVVAGSSTLSFAECGLL